MIDFIYINSIEEKCHIKISTHSYRNLMSCIVDLGYEEFGACKGRAWCGTCAVKAKKILQPINVAEKDCLSKHLILSDDIRLACQIQIDETIDGLVFEYLDWD